MVKSAFARPRSHVDRVLDAAIAQHTQALLKAPLGDSHRHAQIKGHIAGLDEARGLVRKALRLDVDPDQHED